MPRPLKALLAALLLTACGASPKIAPPSFLPKPPPPPVAAIVACLPVLLATNADGEMTSAQAEGAIRAGDAALFECEAKRQLLIDAWPR